MAIPQDHIHTNVLHANAHFDEWGAEALYIMFEEQRPGGSSKRLEFWDRLKEGKTWQQLEQEGYRLIGFGGGPGDEHPDPLARKFREQKHSAISLVARKLGVAHDPKLEPLLRFATSRDLGIAGYFEIPRVVKDMGYLGRTPIQVFQWMLRGFTAMYEGSPEFFAGGVKEDAGPGWTEMVRQWIDERFGSFPKDDPAFQPIMKFTAQRNRKPHGTAFEVHAILSAVRKTSSEAEAKEWAFTALDVLYEREQATLEVKEELGNAEMRCLSMKKRNIAILSGYSSSPYFASAARQNRNAGVVIQMDRKTGNVNIQTDNRLCLDLSKVVMILRAKELKVRKEALQKGAGLLSAEGTIAGWHFFPKGRMILRGTFSHYAPPTALSLATIVQSVCEGLQD